MMNGTGIESAHIAFDSDCFSKATVSTRSCTPACTREAATMAVEPPTEPAVCTRSSGLPAAPSASARYSSGIMTPSKRSGALPTTTASMSSKVRPASSRARSTASRRRPAIETSSRLARWWVWPTPMTAAGILAISAVSLLGVEDAHEVLLQHRPGRRVRERLVGPAGPDAGGGLADPVYPRGEHRVGGERPARRVDRHVAGEAERPAPDELLVEERCGQLRQVDAVDTGSRAGRGGAGRDRQVARVERDRLDPVLEAGDPGGPRTDLGRLVPGGDDDRRCTVGDRGAVPAAQRVGVHRLGQDVV